MGTELAVVGIHGQQPGQSARVCAAVALTMRRAYSPPSSFLPAPRPPKWAIASSKLRRPVGGLLVSGRQSPWQRLEKPVLGMRKRGGSWRAWQEEDACTINAHNLLYCKAKISSGRESLSMYTTRQVRGFPSLLEEREREEKVGPLRLGMRIGPRPFQMGLIDPSQSRHPICYSRQQQLMLQD